MSATDDFLNEMRPLIVAADTALHDGDPAPRMALWSRTEPLTLFGAARSARGWVEIGPLFRQLAGAFSNCTSFENAIIAAGASGDLAYTVAYERTTASVAAAPPKTYSLRVTTVFRREGDTWRIVHRHGDPTESPAATQQMGRLTKALQPG